MPAAEPNKEFQFSMRALLGFITMTCVVLALPGGFVLLIVAGLWLLLGALITRLLMAFRLPLYRLLSGARPVVKKE